ncbi:hypothetical protein L1887_03587 [Cichorium endivia]|nr:hypothetical protein L1887_03587 [Cichorium endivia]
MKQKSSLRWGSDPKPPLHPPSSPLHRANSSPMATILQVAVATATATAMTIASDAAITAFATGEHGVFPMALCDGLRELEDDAANFFITKDVLLSDGFM